MSTIPTIAQIGPDVPPSYAIGSERYDPPLLNSSVLRLFWYDDLREVIQYIKIQLLVLTVLCFGIIFGGCTTTTYTFKVNALTSPQMAVAVNRPESYKIVSSTEELAEQPMLFEEATQYIKTALSGRGYYESPDPEQAEMIIDISYSVSGPLTSKFKRHTEPIIGSFTMVEESYIPVLTFEKRLSMISHDNRAPEKNRSSVQIWKIEIINNNEEEDLNKYIPLMAAALIPYIGETTEGLEVVKIKEEDPAIAFINEGF